MLKRLLAHDEGVLTFEWILLLTLLVIGVIGGLAAIRDGVMHEAQGSTGAIVSLDQSYIAQPPLAVGVDSMTPTHANCTSAAVASAFFDQEAWGDGRVTTFNQINQAANAPTSLCPLP